MHLRRHLPLLTVNVVSLLMITSASAGVFDVKSAEVEKGSFALESSAAYFLGFPDNAERLRHSSELAVGYGATDWLNLGAKLSFDQPLHEDVRLSTAGIEALVVLRKPMQGFGLAWFTGLDFRVAHDDTNTVTFGPVLQFGDEKLALNLNPFFEKTFGRNHEEGLAFAYAWQLKKEVREGVAVGIEGYGTIPDLAHAPGIDFQEHRIGPVLYFERPLGGDVKPAMGSIKDAGNGGAKDAGLTWSLQAGVLLGLTEGTQDVAFKIKSGLSW